LPKEGNIEGRKQRSLLTASSARRDCFGSQETRAEATPLSEQPGDDRWLRRGTRKRVDGTRQRILKIHESIESLAACGGFKVHGNLRKMADFPVVSPPQSSGFSDSIPAAIKTMHHVFS
jgi:hypothetical protein